MTCPRCISGRMLRDLDGPVCVNCGHRPTLDKPMDFDDEPGRDVPKRRRRFPSSHRVRL